MAILLVLLAHVSSRFGRGRMGVDLFFVLSGYLITSIVLREKHEPRFWQMFYVRRFTRIMPPFGLLVLVASLAGLVDWKVLWPYLSLFGANIASLRFPGLMGRALFNLWSLAVEEHFYFFWPGAARRLTKKHLVLVLGTLIVLEPVLRIAALRAGVDWWTCYLLTPFRLDGLAFGSLLAILWSHPGTRERVVTVNRRLFPAVTVLFCLAMPWLSPRTHPMMMSAVGYTLVSLASVTLLATIVSRPAGFCACALSWAPLVWLGQISYGVYLYHGIINEECIDLAQKIHFNHNGFVSSVCAIPICLLISWLSFRYYEKPFLALGHGVVKTLRTNSLVEALRP